MTNSTPIKIIKTKEQHQAYLKEVERLMGIMPKSGSEESDKLEVLSVLISDYENKKFPIEAVDPIDAILFRKNELNLKQIDLAPYIGTKSRVSEVLSRKRPLTVQMIRALSIGLGLSAETLIGLDSEKENFKSKSEINWSRFPISEMINRGWINKIKNKSKSAVEEQVKSFVSSIGITAENASFKRTLKGDSFSPSTKYALFAWVARVIQKARDKKNSIPKFDRHSLSKKFLKDLAQMSWSETGPITAIEFLEKHGICVVIVPHLKGTLIDGAALKDDNNFPIIGLSLRHDRLDNFWFTLLHEVVHIWKHVDNGETYVDNLEHSSVDKVEAEANRLASEAFISRAIWKRSNAYLSPSQSTIDELSRELRIHPSIIAGRIRKETGNYTQFSDLIGQGEVRKLFYTKENSEV